MTSSERGPVKRLLFGSGRRGEGLDATWYGVGTLICLIAGVGGLAQGSWPAALFLIPAVVTGAMTARQIRERNW